MTSRQPSWGDVWLVDLDPTRGHEQAGRRPAVIVSEDGFNHGPGQMVVVVPMTRTARGIPLHVPVNPPEGGVRMRSYAMCDNIRSISTSRLIDHWGTLSPSTMLRIGLRLERLLKL
jgi:mRNA interferase MazF